MPSTYLDTKQKTLCCGCTACENICPVHAIQMKKDALGFSYPEIGKECIQCNLCRKVCAFNSEYNKTKPVFVTEFYAARHKNMDDVLKSRSGATFVALSDVVLEQGGTVYGAGFKDHFVVAHKRAVNKAGRDEFRGSKYVQSDLDGVFSFVKDDLQNGRYVLFSGTPCQVAGLKRYLEYAKIDAENLYLVDIVCHGVPSPYFWRDYLALVEKKRGKKVVSVDFRNKRKFGWKAHRESFEFEDGYTYTYTYTFYLHIMFRNSCEACPFTNTERPSDITLADFWHYERVHPSLNDDDKGLSLLIVSSEKGRKLLDLAERDLSLTPCTKEQCMQTHLENPSQPHPKRGEFERDYEKKGFDYVLRKYCGYGFLNALKRFPKKCAGKIFRTVKNLKHGLK